MGEIRQIGQHSVDRITSAQVITTVNSGIKELLDNALDAGATAIDIRVINQGRDGFSVQDNGSGISEEDFALVAANHATSKLVEFSDLSRVNTLGFRGEALASLCVMGSLEITTNTDSSGLGHKLEFDKQGQVVKTQRVPFPKGTLVEIKDLFANLRSRRMRLEQTIDSQYKNLLALVQEYAMFTPARICVENISRNQKHVALRSQGAELMQRVATVFRGQRTKQVCPVHFTESDLHFPMEIKGVMSKPVPTAGNSGVPFQYLAVNGRPIKHKRIHNVVKEVYRLANLGDAPLYILDLELSPSMFDVNVVPDKRTVLFHKEPELLQGLRGALTEFYTTAEHAVPRLPPAKKPRQSVISFSAFAGSGSLINQGRAKIEPQRTAEVEEAGGITEEHEASETSEASEVSDASKEQEEQEEREMQEKCEEQERRENNEEYGLSDGEQHETTNNEKETENTEEYDDVNMEQDEGQESEERIDHSKEDINEMQRWLVGEDASEELLVEVKDELVEIKDEIDLTEDPLTSTPHTDHTNCDTEGPQTRLRQKTLNSHIHLPLSLSDIEEEIAKSVEDAKPLKHLLPWRVDEVDAEERLQLTIHKKDFAEMEIVGQFNLGFILVVNRKANLDDLFVIDQHASDEIYNFETLQQKTVMNRQPLVAPFPLKLSAVEELVVQENLPVFENNGFSIKIDRTQVPGKQCFLTSVPYSKSTLFDESDVLELLTKIKNSPNTPNLRCSKLRAMFAMRACRSSIMIGQPLKMSRMEEVVRHMGTLDRPWNCPHGRPTLRHITTLK